MRRYIIILLLGLIVGCSEKDDAIDPKLVGTWRGGGTSYTFENDYTFYQLYTTAGDTANPVIADSLFGNYVLDNNKNLISFEYSGYRLFGTDSIVYKSISGTTWEYEINGSVLNYSSNTTIGELKKIN